MTEGSIAGPAMRLVAAQPARPVGFRGQGFNYGSSGRQGARDQTSRQGPFAFSCTTNLKACVFLSSIYLEITEKLSSPVHVLRLFAIFAITALLLVVQPQKADFFFYLYYLEGLPNRLKSSPRLTLLATATATFLPGQPLSAI